MARAIWTGAISFGLVNVPVKLYSAVEDKAVRFHQLQEGSGRRVHQRRVVDGSDEEVAFDDIVKGYEIEKGEYVVVTPEELEAVAPGRSRTIEIEDFVELTSVDPLYFNRSYYLGPASGDGDAKPYELLRRAMQDAGRVAIARFVMRDTQYLAAIRPLDDVLVLETMHFPDEVRPAGAVENLPKGVRLTERERDIAAQLIDSLTSDWEPDRYHDTYRERVLDLVKAKAKGEAIVTDQPEESGKVLDLMAALEASVEAAKGGRRSPSGKNDDLASRSKRELAELAKERDIEGRSSMTKDELVEALRDAS